MSIVFSMIVRENLPNDTVELKGLVYQLLDVVEQQKLLIANQNERIEAQSQRIDQLTDQVNALKRHQFGKRSEKNQKEIEKEKEEESEKTSSQDGYEWPKAIPGRDAKRERSALYRHSERRRYELFNL